jgi:hypothetical protein
MRFSVVMVVVVFGLCGGVVASGLMTAVGLIVAVPFLLGRAILCCRS